MLRAAPFKCKECDHFSPEEWIESKDWDVPLDCPICGTKSSMVRQFAMPMLMGVTRKNGEPVGATPDGVTGWRGEGHKKLKEANKIQQQMYNQPHGSEERVRLAKEYNKLKKI